MARTAREKAAPKQLTTAQRLGSIIKSARKIMRKDKGLNGDLDRLPMLTWIMFLKFLDDMERIEEERGPGGQGLPLGHRAAVSLARLGGGRRRDHRAGPAVVSSTAERLNAPMAPVARGCSPICAPCAATTATIGAT